MAEQQDVKVSAFLSPDLVKALDELAAQRGVTANTVLRQAIETEKFFAGEVKAGGKVLVEKPDRSFRLITFNDP